MALTSPRESSRAFFVSILFLFSATLTGIAGFHQAYPALPWRAVVSLAALGLLALIAGFSAFLSKQDRSQLAGKVLAGGLMALMPVHVGMLADLGVLLGIVLVLEVTLIANLTLPPERAGPLVLWSLLEAGCLLLLDLYWPWYRVTVTDVTRLLLPTGIGSLGFALLLARQFPHYSLQVKLILVFLAGTLIPLSLLAVLNGRALQTVLLKQVEADLRSVANSRAASIALLIDKQTEFLNAVSLSQTILAEVVAANESYPAVETQNLASLQNHISPLDQIIALDQEWRAAVDTDPLVREQLDNPAAREFRDYLSFSPDQVELFVTDRYGALVAASRRTSDYFQADEQWWQAAWNGGKGALYISQPQLDESTGTLALRMAEPVYDDSGIPVGVLATTYDLVPIKYILVSTRFGRTGEAHLLNAEGGHLLDDSHERDEPEGFPSIIQSEDYSLEEMCGDVLCIVSQALVVLPEDSWSAEAIAGLGWTVVVHQLRSESLAPVETARRNALLLAVAAVGLVSIFAIRAAKLLADPIAHLNQSVDRMAGGDLGVRTGLTSPIKELNHLGDAFNHMAEALEQRAAERKRAQDEIQRGAARAEALVHVAAQLNAQLDLEEVITTVCEATARTLDSAAFVCLYDERRDLLSFKGGSGISFADHQPRPSIPYTVFDQVDQQTGGVAMIPDMQRLLEGLCLNHSECRKAHSGAGALMLRQGKVIGALLIAENGNPRQITADDLVLLKGIADQAAQAITNARLYGEANLRLRQTQALRNIDVAITSSLDLSITLQVLLQELTSQLCVDAAALLLFDPPSRALKYAATRGFPFSKVEHVCWGLGEGYPGWAALERRTISIHDDDHLEDTSFPAPLAEETFQSYLCLPLVVKGEIKGVLEVFHRNPLDPEDEWLAFLEALAGQAAIAIDSGTLFENLQQSNTELSTAYDSTLEGWSRALDLRDRETEGHTQRVAELTLRLARSMGIFTESELVHLRRGALLHDIGKLGIPDRILLKPGPLSEDEWAIMCKHPQYAYEMLSFIPYLQPALDIPYAHHEKWDGTGYPQGLKGEQIPLAARVFAVVDVWDALNSDRPYRPAWPEEKAIAFIREESGKHFDPQVVESFMKLFPGFDLDSSSPL